MREEEEGGRGMLPLLAIVKLFRTAFFLAFFVSFAAFFFFFFPLNVHVIADSFLSASGVSHVI